VEHETTDSSNSAIRLRIILFIDDLLMANCIYSLILGEKSISP
jgi:hypothetical protein